MNKNVDCIIVGQGIAGSLLTWRLWQSGKSFIVIDRGADQSASAVSSGIINPITGRRFVKSWMIDELLPAAKKIYGDIARELNIKILTERSVIRRLSSIPESADMSGYAYLKDNIGMLVLSLIGVLIVSSFGEEVVYRGFLINRISELGLTSKNGKIIAVILSAIIFGFAHYSWGPMRFGQTTFIGIALGLCYIFMKKRLWILIIAHAYMDTILMVQLYLASN